MEIRDLEYFLACSETRNFTAAARRVHIVQSAMSAAIARLEADLGVTLFDRSTNPIELTAEGEALAAAAPQVLDAVQAARDQTAAVTGTVRGTVVLGSTLNTGSLDLAEVLVDLRARHPEVAVHLRQSSTGSSGNLAALLSGSLDMALTGGDRPPPEGVTLHPLSTEPLAFVCRPDHPLADRAVVGVADLAGQALVRFPPGWGIRATIDRVLGPAPDAIEVADYQLMRRLVAAGFGTTLMPASAVEDGSHLRAVPVDDPRLRWDLAAAVSARRRPRAATAALLTALSDGAGGGTGR
jgi:DNA-binding transcriptional LysR family regulator